MEKTNFENLQIYQLAEKLADDIWNIVLKWDQFSKDTVGKQIVRAADSIGANIAEGNGKGTDVDYRRFLRNARGSLYEVKHWITRANQRNLLTETQLQRLLPTLEELLPKLNAYLRSVSNRIRNE